MSTFFAGKRAAKRGAGADDDEDGAYGEEDEQAAPDEAAESDESEAEARRAVEQRRKAKATARGAAGNARAARQHAIRATDIPERLYERHLQRQANLAGLDEEDRDRERREESLWVFQQLFVDPLSPFTHKVRSDGRVIGQVHDEVALVPTIQHVLHALQEEHLEMPFIATYQKDSWGGASMPPQARRQRKSCSKSTSSTSDRTELGGRAQEARCAAGRVRRDGADSESLARRVERLLSPELCDSYGCGAVRVAQAPLRL